MLMRNMAMAMALLQRMKNHAHVGRQYGVKAMQQLPVDPRFIVG